MVNCPACQLELATAGATCPRCSPAPVPPQNLPQQGAAPEPGSVPAAPANWASVPGYSSPLPEAVGRAKYSSVQPVWQFLLLQFCSFGFYYLIWFYQNWRLIKERKGWDITPAARAIFALFWVRSFCHELLQLAESVGYKTRWNAGLIATPFVILSLLNRAAERAEEPLSTILTILIAAGQCLIMVPIVQALNAFWKHEQPHLPVRRWFSPGAWVVVILGGLFWSLILISMFIPETEIG